MPTPTLPNPTVVARQALVAQGPITSAVGQRVYYAIPAEPVWPLLVITLVDADEQAPECLTARVQIDVWGNGMATQDVLDSAAIASTIRAVARDLVGQWSAGRITNAVAGLVVPMPDDQTGRARHVVDLLLLVNP